MTLAAGWRGMAVAGALLVAGCGGSPEAGDANAVATVETPRTTMTATPSPAPRATALGSCREEIGAAAAALLAAQCRDASPASHPPCNVANSCAIMREEIRRSCALSAATDPLPASLCAAGTADTAAAEATPATPTAVVQAYYDAIAARDYGRAYRLWGDNGRASGKTLAAFTKGFADTARTAVEIGQPAAPEGAAGSIYVTVPVTVRAVTGEGRRQLFKGQYVIRRVNDVPGASAADLAWHIDSARLIPAR